MSRNLVLSQFTRLKAFVELSTKVILLPKSTQQKSSRFLRVLNESHPAFIKTLNKNHPAFGKFSESFRRACFHKKSVYVCVNPLTTTDCLFLLNHKKLCFCCKYVQTRTLQKLEGNLLFTPKASQLLLPCHTFSTIYYRAATFTRKLVVIDYCYKVPPDPPKV